ncbi:hypothetical protein PAF17_16095 [Paracoccus sp. Z330]|uniref:DNA recombination protein RmuC n=1 Tax=Paracoccus onchidii TaxID=3017813 RepID=A0ABT4ZIH4_9RHOB|nr:hypothetical protein [Paracoccus onchidii]MDB6179014.1 hypothetical protein [Paracoccus onchidii]
MNPEFAIETIKGGQLSALVIVALAIAVVMLFRWGSKSQNDRLTDLREANRTHQELSREMSRAMDALTNSLRDDRR